MQTDYRSSAKSSRAEDKSERWATGWIRTIKYDDIQLEDRVEGVDNP